MLMFHCESCECQHALSDVGWMAEEEEEEVEEEE
jgi:hypothetical protein